MSRATSGLARVVDLRRAVATRVDVKRILKLLTGDGKIITRECLYGNKEIVAEMLILLFFIFCMMRKEKRHNSGLALLYRNWPIYQL
jgi:hypothetical protein